MFKAIKHMGTALIFLLAAQGLFAGCWANQAVETAAEVPGTTLSPSPTRDSTNQTDPPHPSPSVTETEISSTPTAELTAAMTAPEKPPNDWIAFRDLWTIAIIKTNGSGKRSIIDGKFDPRNPTWSPDGQWIAFSGYSSTSNCHQIYLVRPDGSELSQITFAPGDKYNYSWSPDGQSIVYSQITRKIKELRGSKVDLYLFDIPLAEITQLTNTDTIYEHFPKFSPDGDILAYIAIEENTWPKIFKLMTLDLKQNIPQQVVDEQIDIKDFTWSSDGTKITFISSGSKTSGFACNDFYEVNTDGSELKRLTNNDSSYGSPSWDENGEWLIYTEADCHYPAATGFRTIYIIDSNWDNKFKVPNTYKDHSPTWSPWPGIEVGEQYLITELGKNLQLRSSPAVSGEVLDQLDQGQVIMVIEGPVEADEYLWWRVRLNDGGLEGWVAENPGWFIRIE